MSEGVTITLENGDELQLPTTAAAKKALGSQNQSYFNESCANEVLEVMRIVQDTQTTVELSQRNTGLTVGTLRTRTYNALRYALEFLNQDGKVSELKAKVSFLQTKDSLVLYPDVKFKETPLLDNLQKMDAEVVSKLETFKKSAAVGDILSWEIPLSPPLQEKLINLLATYSTNFLAAVTTKQIKLLRII